jgi:hypothetical protein
MKSLAKTNFVCCAELLDVVVEVVVVEDIKS